MVLPDLTSSWLFKPINSRSHSKDAMCDEHPSLCELWPKFFFPLTEELSSKACQSQHRVSDMAKYYFEVHPRPLHIGAVDDFRSKLVHC